MKHVKINPATTKPARLTAATAGLLLLASLAGCDSIPFINNTADYKAAGRGRPLEVPPDLTASPTSDAYSIPGSTSYSTYSQAQEVQDTGVEKVLASPEGVRLVRAGGQRWLVVNAPVEQIWPVIREFWTDMGFAVRVENPQVGVMETEWIDADAIKKDDSGNIGQKFDKWLDKLSGFADKKKFRTRLDRGVEANTTEIFMTHRSVAVVPDDGKNIVRTQLGNIDTGYKADAKTNAGDVMTASEAELDIELLRRLMVKLGVEEQKSKTIIADAVVLKRAEVVQEADGSAMLVLDDQFDRAWRRVGLALDRIGFVIEDKDRSTGTFFVRYADVDIDDTAKKKKGLFESLKFWGDDDKKAAEPKKEEKSMIEKLKFWGTDDKQKTNPDRQYRIKVADADKDKSTVAVVDKDGTHMRTTTANRIVALIYEQLK
jgi:outer membrane protein assembly factor BamC